MWDLGGVEKARTKKGYSFQDEETRPETARLAGEIHGERHPFVEHFRFVQKLASDGIIARQTIPAPAQLLAELQRDVNRDSTARFYPDIDNLMEDVASAYRRIIRDLYVAGCRSLQLDDCTWGMFCDDKFRAFFESGGGNVKAVQNLYARINNRALEGCPEDLVVTTHVCRGNYHSAGAFSGGYGPVWEVLFGTENVDAFYLEYDTDRAGDFSPLSFVPKHRLVILGLVTSKNGTMGSRDVILRRIEEASPYVDNDRLCLSPTRIRLHGRGQCPHGGATMEKGSPDTGNRPGGLGMLR